MADPQEEYRDFLDHIHGLPDGVTEDRTGWAIRDDGAADYAIRKIGAAEAEQHRQAAFVAAEIERLQAWFAMEMARHRRTIEFFAGHLRQYADQLVEAGQLTERRKSYKLPHGTLQFRSQPVEYERDDTKILEWVRANPGLVETLIRTKEELAWGELKPLLTPQADQALSPVTAFGEVIPGVRVKQPAREVFQVRPSID